MRVPESGQIKLSFRSMARATSSCNSSRFLTRASSLSNLLKKIEIRSRIQDARGGQGVRRVAERKRRFMVLSFASVDLLSFISVLPTRLAFTSNFQQLDNEYDDENEHDSGGGLADGNFSG
jgi:hypothetical protein